jgi:hypothetical protein
VPGGVESLGESERFAVHPTIAVNAAGQPVVAWEEADSIWGRDFPFEADRDAATTAANRRIRAAFKTEAGWRDLPSPAQSLPADRRLSARMPRIALNRRGVPILSFRVLAEPSLGRSDFRAAVERWESYVTQWSGSEWRTAELIPLSNGRYWLTAALATSVDEVRAVWTADSPGNPRGGDLDVFAASVLVADGAAPLW